MKPKTARRFLNRNQVKVNMGIGNPSLWRRVGKCQDVLARVAYGKQDAEERLFSMSGRR